MRVNIYAEEMSKDIEIISKTINGQEFLGLRFYLYLPVTDKNGNQRSGKFIHKPGDDDSAAVTFWGKRNLIPLLERALSELDMHYASKGYPRERGL